MRPLYFFIALMCGLQFSYASSLPTVPDIDECQWNDGEPGYCMMTETQGFSSGGIKVSFFARIAKDDFDNRNEILDRYFDFEAWPDYAEGSEYPMFKISEPLEDLFETRGDLQVLIKRHHVKYISDAPFPLTDQTIHEVSHYEEIAPWDGAFVSWKFYLDESFPELEGIKKKSGTLHAREGEEFYHVYILFEVIPGIDVLPSLAAPYVRQSVEAIFKGMFNFVE